MTSEEKIVNFKEFQATGRDVEDIGPFTGDEDYAGVPGRVYCDGLWIQRVSANDFACTVFNDSIIDHNLETVEKFLYDNLFTDGVCCI
jgi:hypothetical protein